MFYQYKSPITVPLIVLSVAGVHVTTLRLIPSPSSSLALHPRAKGVCLHHVVCEGSTEGLCRSRVGYEGAFTEYPRVARSLCLGIMKIEDTSHARSTESRTSAGLTSTAPCEARRPERGEALSENPSLRRDLWSIWKSLTPEIVLPKIYNFITPASNVMSPMLKDML
ncbi:hypothetical protein KM043_014569 [Ampulex compressa]|nr:hypothetical protein KM043_014569 [Ampulex compressa]